LGHKFTLTLVLLALAYVVYQYGIAAISAPIPRSLLLMYMGITLLALLLGISSNQAWWEEFLQPLRVLLLERERTPIIRLRRGIGVLIPLLAGVLAFGRMNPTIQPPAELRAIHPAPPTTIQFRGETIHIQGLDNPFWKGPPERPDPALVEEGREIYATHCIFCHGDALDGNGIFAEGLNPRPADFTDPGTIAQLQQSYLFWRIAKGGIGLPNESAPWNSAMPAWEDTLTADEIWKVIIYLYEAAGPAINPRTWEE
jgi:mono/diheme cytochrome c family protein